MALLVALISTNGLRAAPTWSVSSRFAGTDRYSTAVKATNGFPTVMSPWNSLVLVSGETYADSLSGSALAAKLGSLLLITRPEVIPTVVQEEILRLSPKRVIVVGGEVAVRPQVIDSLRALGIRETVRIAGSDRYETSIEVAKFGWPQGATRIFIAPGEEFGPGLIAGAAAGAFQAPLLLTKPSEVTATTRTELQRLSAQTAVIFSYNAGPGMISSNVSREIGSLTAGTDVMISGWNMVELSNTWLQGRATDSILGDPYKNLPRGNLVTSAGFPDALVAGAISGFALMPLFVTDPSCLPIETETSIKFLGRTLINVFGGEAAISSAAVAGNLCGTAGNQIAPPTTVSSSTNQGTSVQLPADGSRVLIYGTESQFHFCLSSGRGSKFSLQVRLSNGSWKGVASSTVGSLAGLCPSLGASYRWTVSELGVPGPSSCAGVTKYTLQMRQVSVSNGSTVNQWTMEQYASRADHGKILQQVLDKMLGVSLSGC